jgi:hypothetical protein
MIGQYVLGKLNGARTGPVAATWPNHIGDP